MYFTTNNFMRMRNTCHIKKTKQRPNHTGKKRPGCQKKNKKKNKKNPPTN